MHMPYEMLNPLDSPVNEPEKTPDTPETPASQEKLPYTERRPEEQKLHLERMKTFAEEWGFVQTPELDALRGDIPAWADKAQEIMTAVRSAKSKIGVYIDFGYQVALASIFYERRGPENEEKYFTVLKDLYEELRDANLLEMSESLKDTFE